MTLIALQLVARWCFSFGHLRGRGVNGELKKASGWGSRLNPPRHTVPLCQRRYPRPPFPPPLSFCISPTLHRFCSDSNWRSGLLNLDNFFLSLPFFFFFISLPLPCSSSSYLPLSLSRMGLISVRTNSLIVFSESRQGTDRRLISLKPG